MIIFYYLQQKNNANKNTVAIKCYDEANVFADKINNIYFYIEADVFKLTPGFNQQTLQKDYILIKKIEIPCAETKQATIGLEPAIVIAKCKKYINEANSATHNHVCRELQRHSICYPLGNVLFQAAYKAGIPAPFELLSAPTLEDFAKAVETLILNS